MRISEHTWVEWKKLHEHGDIKKICNSEFRRDYVSMAIRDGCGSSEILNAVSKYYEEKSNNMQRFITDAAPF